VDLIAWGESGGQILNLSGDAQPRGEQLGVENKSQVSNPKGQARNINIDEGRDESRIFLLRWSPGGSDRTNLSA